ncbi:MAG: CPXCG motif-containing cysteine-rich protein [Candidatus Omnitrophica bacterium]|nr:CPXCG motif-containing cysteine-rich protein [Candidatus Omnitrophota bacterium]
MEEYENFLCPYCGQPNQLIVDMTGGSRQELIVDCEVCCAPIVLRIRLHGKEILSVEARKEND